MKKRKIRKMELLDTIEGKNKLYKYCNITKLWALTCSSTCILNNVLSWCNEFCLIKSPQTN